MKPRFLQHSGLVLLAAAIVAACLLALERLRPVRARLANDRLRFAVCQYDSRPDAYDWNLRHALAYAQEAADHGAGFVILPEYSFCTADDALNGDAFRFFRRNAKRIERRLSGFSRRNRCYLLVNVLHEDPDWKGAGGTAVRRNRSMLFAPSGDLVRIYDKRQTAILDEVSDWTEDCERDPVWLTNDMGTSDVDFPRIGKRLARTFARPFALLANKTGFEPNGGFTGGACAISKKGDVVAQAGFGSDILYVDAPLDESGRLAGGDPVPFHPDR